jgi:plastocyanin
MRSLLWAIALFVCTVPSWAGEIAGKVTITRTLTKKRVVVDVYAPRGGAPAAASSPQDLDEWGRTVVYLDTPGMAAPSAGDPPATVAQIGQRNRRFEKEVLVIPVGGSVSFPNGDPIFHNVFSLSKAKAFDLGYYPQGQTRTVRFDKPGPVQVFCHLHTNMSAAILVVPNAMFAQPSSDGAFRIAGVPPGKHLLRLWHRSAGFLQQEVEVPAEGSVNVSFNLPLATIKSVGP